MKLPVGTHVVLSQRGRDKWTHSSGNPHNVLGKVVRFDEQDYDEGEKLFFEGEYDEEECFPFSVRWSNGFDNVYRYGDLEPIDSFKDVDLKVYM